MDKWTVRGVEIQKYDVVQVNYGQEWMDYATILNGQDVSFGVRLVREGGGFNSHPPALYRIARGDAVVFEVGGLDDEIKGLLVLCKQLIEGYVPSRLRDQTIERINKLI